MASPTTSPVVANGALVTNNHDEKQVVPNNVTDSPTEMSDAGGEAETGNGHLGGEGEIRSDSEDDDEYEDDEDQYDSEGTDSEDEDEDEEPALKYERIGGSLHDLLKKDAASALAISNKLLVTTLCVLCPRIHLIFV